MREFTQRHEHPEYYERDDRQILLDILFTAKSAIQPRLRYIDRSKWNSEDDYKKLAEGGDIVALSHKLTQGTSYPLADIKLGQDRLKKAFDAGLLVQGYHFFNDFSGTAEAEYFLEAFYPVAQYTGGVYLPSMNDVEINYGITQTTRANRVGNWLSLVSQEQGRLAMWYSSKYLFESLLGQPSWRNDYHKHIASWTSGASPSMPNGVNTDKLFGWQYGVCGQHSWATCPPGVVGACDINYLMISLEAAKELAGDKLNEELLARIEELEFKHDALKTRVNELEAGEVGQEAAIKNLTNTVIIWRGRQINLTERVDRVDHIFSELLKLLS